VRGGLLEVSSDRDDALGDAKLLGLDFSASDLLPGQEGKVWEDHVPALEAFLSVSTQWQLTGLADGKIFAAGLDYGGVKKGLKMAGIKMTRRLWAELRMIEFGARRAMNGNAQ
jgi:hypothetical protein